MCESEMAAVRISEVVMASTHPEWSADKVRGGEIELRKLWQKIVFMFGLFGAVLLLLLADLFWR